MAKLIICFIIILVILKEYFMLNQEFLVIFGLATILILILNMIGLSIKNLLHNYAENIQSKFITKINTAQEIMDFQLEQHSMSSALLQTNVIQFYDECEISLSSLMENSVETLDAIDEKSNFDSMIDILYKDEITNEMAKSIIST